MEYAAHLKCVAERIVGSNPTAGTAIKYRKFCMEKRYPCARCKFMFSLSELEGPLPKDSQLVTDIKGAVCYDCYYEIRKAVKEKYKTWDKLIKEK